MWIVHCNGNSVYIFIFWELRGLSPNFHIHVSVSDLYSIFPASVHIFPPAEKADPSYIIRSQSQECGNWDWGPDIPFLGIFVSNFRHFDFAVWMQWFLVHQNPRAFKIYNRKFALQKYIWVWQYVGGIFVSTEAKSQRIGPERRHA